MAGNLSRSQILEAEDLPLKEVQVPEWKGTVFIRMLSAGERDAFEAFNTDEASARKDLRARLAVATVCDAEGKPLFTAEDIGLLTKKSGRALDRIFAAAAKHNGITAADVEELRKNS